MDFNQYYPNCCSDIHHVLRALNSLLLRAITKSNQHNIFLTSRKESSYVSDATLPTQTLLQSFAKTKCNLAIAAHNSYSLATDGNDSKLLQNMNLCV